MELGGVSRHRMTSEDYWNLPDNERAELIDGELWNLAATSRTHQFIQGELVRRLGNYIQQHNGRCQVYPAPFAVNLFADDSTFVEPDVSVVCNHAKLSDRGCEGAPDLVIEIVSPSSRAMDYRTKLSLYTEAGVREYLMVDPSMSRTTVIRTDPDEDPAPMIYPFSTPVPVGIFPGLVLNLEEIVDNL